ncbi:MAG: hypothetical protein CVU00_02410 [Bacteroidetes bacterium HGW-Bacteroidetes-17]|jgi:hypothetical protein|nr:MAG: hypothetical protein CVU00_02410 [Bacteroidetes bacterium HGW-Bacteroidetes-17]
MKKKNDLEKEKLHDPFHVLVSNILKIRMAIQGGFPELYEYIKKEHKEIVLADTRKSELNKLGKLKGLSSGIIKHIEKNKRIWEDFARDEKEAIESLLNNTRGFTDIGNKFSYESAKELINAAVGADKCIYYNTYIDLDNGKDWYSPVIQMHQCIQKSIEIKNNLIKILQCHSKFEKKIIRECPAIEIVNSFQDAKVKKLNNKDLKDIKQKLLKCHQVVPENLEINYSCISNPPKYRQYRIIFLPLTDTELDTRLHNDKSFSDNLQYTTIMHCALSIQLAILTAQQFGIIAKQNPFFTNPDNLEILGLDRSLAEDFKKGELPTEAIPKIKMGISGKTKLPESQEMIGMDFIHINFQKNEEQSDSKGEKKDDDYWGAFKNDKDELMYYRFQDDKIRSVKREFSDILFQEIRDDSSPYPPANDIVKDLDPLWSFYDLRAKVGDAKYKRLKPKYDAKKHTGLY